MIRACWEDEGAPAPEPTAAKPSPIDVQAAQYHLSEREHEVLVEFARATA